jgi:phospholipase D1/2
LEELIRSELLEPGATCTTIERASHTRVLVDGEEYYPVLCDAMRHGRKYVCMTGWQFDTRANLAPEGKEALQFLAFLNSLCEANEDLEIFITAWNYSVFYAIEREWFQNVRFAIQAHPRIHFRFLNHPEPGAAHHEKIVIVDGVVAFTGGLDVCDERWDSRGHLPSDVRRTNVSGAAYGPFHDVQMLLTGEVVAPLEEFFWQSWVQAGGDMSDRPQRPAAALSEAGSLSADTLSNPERGIVLRAPRVALSRTRVEDGACFEIEELLIRAVDRAEYFIYAENQYFTSKAFVKALIGRMGDGQRSKLDVVFVLPEGGHSKKEELVLGSRQRLMLWLVQELARTQGHQLRVFKSCSVADDGERIATYIHSKVAIVDERFVTIGSANLMNRSMRVDHELNVSVDVELCETDAERRELESDIRQLRASLLAEHAGTHDVGSLLETNGLLVRLDQACEDPKSKLWPQTLERPEEDDRFFSSLCDPAEPLDWKSVQGAVDTLFESDQTLVKGAARRVGQRLGVVDIEQDEKRAG